jgi:hypothetical protein
MGASVIRIAMKLISRNDEKELTTNDSNQTNKIKTGSRRALREKDAPGDCP